MWLEFLGELGIDLAEEFTGVKSWIVGGEKVAGLFSGTSLGSWIHRTFYANPYGRVPSLGTEEIWTLVLNRPGQVWHTFMGQPGGFEESDFPGGQIKDKLPLWFNLSIYGFTAYSVYQGIKSGVSVWREWPQSLYNYVDRWAFWHDPYAWENQARAIGYGESFAPASPPTLAQLIRRGSTFSPYEDIPPWRPMSAFQPSPRPGPNGWSAHQVDCVLMSLRGAKLVSERF